jgi:DNA-binding NtrC family response regulator
MTSGGEQLERRKPRILVVDDEPANLGTFVRSFRKEYLVLTAGSGVAALEELDRTPVDILITDYTMPTMNGLQLLHSVATRWPTVRRLMISGHADLPELLDAQRIGLVAEVIPKPFRKAEILETVGRLLFEARATDCGAAGP